MSFPDPSVYFVPCDRPLVQGDAETLRPLKGFRFGTYEELCERIEETMRMEKEISKLQEALEREKKRPRHRRRDQCSYFSKVPDSHRDIGPRMGNQYFTAATDSTRALPGSEYDRQALRSSTGLTSAPIAQRAIHEPSLSARLKGNDVVAFPDTGAAANFISLQYVRARGLAINLNARRRVKTAAGSIVSILGTVTLPFSFAGEPESHRLEFNVLRDAVHDVVLGSPFLKLTETMTRHVHRIKQKLREACSPRLCFLGSQQYVGGWANGTYVDAMPDTGAHVSVMSASFAREHGFAVNTAEIHQKDLEFADGSMATTMGIVEAVDWSFKTSQDSHWLEVYVLEGLQTDLILDNTFLIDTDAFVMHEDDFWVDDDNSSDDLWSISIIKLVDKALKGSRWEKPASSPGSAVPDDPEALWQLEKSDRLNAYRLARKQAQSMPEDQRRSFLKPHLAQWEYFLQSRPNNASMSQSSLSQVASSTSLTSGPAGAPVSNATSTPGTSGKTRFFSKLRGIKGKASSPAGTSSVAS